MLSFHNDSSIKEKYLSRVIKHREMYNIIQGIGWENGKGCAIGCTLESYAHFRYPIELGIPIWLAYLEDNIFENLPTELAMTWPERFLSSIPVGVDLENIKHEVAIKRLNRLIELQEENSIDQNLKNEVIDSIKMVIQYHVNAAKSAFWSAKSAKSAAKSAFWSAKSAAESAFWSAKSAAESDESAYWSAKSAFWSAKSAAESAAESAESAARSAAKSAESAARSAFWSAFWSAESAAASYEFIKQSEELLQELADCK